MAIAVADFAALVKNNQSKRNKGTHKVLMNNEDYKNAFNLLLDALKKFDIDLKINKELMRISNETAKRDEDMPLQVSLEILWDPEESYDISNNLLLIREQERRCLDGGWNMAIDDEIIKPIIQAYKNEGYKMEVTMPSSDRYTEETSFKISIDFEKESPLCRFYRKQLREEVKGGKNYD